MDYARIISASAIAEDLTDGQIQRLARIAIFSEYSPGDIIIKENDKTTDLFIIHEGHVSVEIKRFPYDAASQPFLLIKAKGLVGEFSFIDRSPRSANVRAHDKVTCLVLPGDKLESLIQSDYEIGFLLMRNMARLLSARIRGANLELRNQLIW
ncbi:hypothetical protein MNBD_NITROSPINAE04-1396 [hydrothermal vent metagenome]|uniref:Cyclic nucleotide-binding domain-containing protein n=1 Tax=hydrothermal vent metagenome TaxID=652676 RepID=A0A3B1CKN6_9ZZZZ